MSDRFSTFHKLLNSNENEQNTQKNLLVNCFYIHLNWLIKLLKSWSKKSTSLNFHYLALNKHSNIFFINSKNLPTGSIVLQSSSCAAQQSCMSGKLLLRCSMSWMYLTIPFLTKSCVTYQSQSQYSKCVVASRSKIMLGCFVRENVSARLHSTL